MGLGVWGKLKWDLVRCHHGGTNERTNKRKDRATQPMDHGRLRWAIQSIPITKNWQKYQICWVIFFVDNIAICEASLLWWKCSFAFNGDTGNFPDIFRGTHLNFVSQTHIIQLCHLRILCFRRKKFPPADPAMVVVYLLRTHLSVPQRD